MPCVKKRPLVESGAAAASCRLIVLFGPGSPYHSTPSEPFTRKSLLKHALSGLPYWCDHSPAPASLPRRNTTQLSLDCTSASSRRYTTASSLFKASVAAGSAPAERGAPKQATPPHGFT